MKLGLVVLFLQYVLGMSVAWPLWSKKMMEDLFKRDHEYGRYFEGDLAISDEQIALHYGETAMIATTGIKDLSQRWPEGKMYYALDSSLPPSTLSNIKQAMEMWSSKTCITFILRHQQSDYVYITSDGSGCYSDHVGYSGGKQTINIQYPGCTRSGTIAHEIGHNLGLWHEHTRPDRDKYVTVLKDNIKKADMTNFIKRKANTVNMQGLEYDFDSIMHYRSNAFTRNGEDTIEVKDTKTFEQEGSPDMGQRDHLSQGDVATINKLYKCPGY